MAVQHKYTISQIGDLRAQFNAFDKDGSGAVSIDEMIIVLRNVGLEVSDEIVLAMIKEFDVNGDGQISFREFLNMMWKLQTGPATVAAAPSASPAAAPAAHPTHFFAWGPADVYTIMNLSSRAFLTIRGGGVASGATEGAVECGDVADAAAPDVPFRIHCRKDELMLQCYVNGLFLTAARDGTGVTGTREPVPGLSMWKFRRLGGGKFTLQNAALGTFLEAGGAAAAEGGGAGGERGGSLQLVAVHGSPRVEAPLKWRINEGAPIPAAGKRGGAA